MIIIDTRTDKAHENLSYIKAAELIGVNERTVRRWASKGIKQVYNFFEVYFDTQKHKKKKGQPRIPPAKKQADTKSFRRM